MSDWSSSSSSSEDWSMSDGEEEIAQYHEETAEELAEQELFKLILGERIEIDEKSETPMETESDDEVHKWDTWKFNANAKNQKNWALDKAFPHLGPGNPILPKSSNPIDDIARDHDIEYSKAKHPLDVFKADQKFLERMSKIKPTSFHEWLARNVGLTGINMKHNFERHFGVLYPKFNASEIESFRENIPNFETWEQQWLSNKARAGHSGFTLITKAKGNTSAIADIINRLLGAGRAKVSNESYPVMNNLKTGLLYKTVRQEENAEKFTIPLQAFIIKYMNKLESTYDKNIQYLLTNPQDKEHLKTFENYIEKLDENIYKDMRSKFNNQLKSEFPELNEITRFWQTDKHVMMINQAIRDFVKSKVTSYDKIMDEYKDLQNSAVINNQ